MELQTIQQKIYEARGQKVMLDFDLAQLYQVETRVLNQAVKRNIDLFPEDFLFQLSPQEWGMMSSQIVMTSGSKRPKISIPQAFTEHGVLMLSNILRSKTARQTSIMIVRAFVYMRQFSLSHRDLTDKLNQMEHKYNKQFRDIHEATAKRQAKNGPSYP